MFCTVLFIANDRGAWIYRQASLTKNPARLFSNSDDRRLG